MVLKDLFLKYTEQQILDKTMELYPDQVKNLDGYKIAVNEIRNMRKTKSAWKINLREWDEVDEETKEKSHYIDVVAWNPEEPDQPYSLSMTTWSQWLGMSVHEDTLAKYTELDILGHILWEMTWNGYSQKQVKSERAKMDKLFKEATGRIAEDMKGAA